MAAKTERVPIMFDKGLLLKVDEWRFSSGVASRSEAIRRLITEKLNDKNKEADALAS